MKTKVKVYICIFLVTILITANFLLLNKKDNIYNATIIELDSVQEIGKILSNRIYTYVQTNGIDNVEALKGNIEYLGEVRLKELKKIYK